MDTCTEMSDCTFMCMLDLYLSICIRKKEEKGMRIFYLYNMMWAMVMTSLRHLVQRSVKSLRCLKGR